MVGLGMGEEEDQIKQAFVWFHNVTFVSSDDFRISIQFIPPLFQVPALPAEDCEQDDGNDDADGHAGHREAAGVEREAHHDR